MQSPRRRSAGQGRPEGASRPAIAIRRAEPSDAEALHLVFSGPRVVWGTLQLPYPSVEARRKRLEEFPQDAHNLVACVAEEVVGQLTIWTHPERTRQKHVGWIGMCVRDDWQGKGVGTALMEAAVDMADRWLNLSRLELEVYTDNEPAIRLYRKFNFETEGTKKAVAFRDGRYADTLVMGRLRPDE